MCATPLTGAARVQMLAQHQDVLRAPRPPSSSLSATIALRARRKRRKTGRSKIDRENRESYIISYETIRNGRSSSRFKFVPTRCFVKLLSRFVFYSSAFFVHTLPLPPPVRIHASNLLARAKFPGFGETIGGTGGESDTVG